MNKARLNIATSKLVGNKGQLPWLPRNPRTWTLGDVNRTVKSITTDPDFLEDRPLLAVPAESGKGERYIVFAGNLRLKACKESNVKTAPVVVYFPETDEDRETVKRRAMLDNGSFGSWDYDALANEWDDLPLADYGVPAWDAPEAAAAAAAAGGGEGAAATEDDFDENADEIHVRCKPGDIWQLGDHRLMCGDSIDLEQVKTLMGGAEADMIFIDPPYGVSYAEKNEFLNTIAPGNRIQEPIKNDHHAPEEMNAFWEAAFNNLAAVTKEKMVYYITSPQGGDLLLLLLAIHKSPFALKHMLIWNKSNHVLGRCDYNYKHEPMLYGWKKAGTHTFYGKGEFKTTVWDIEKPMKNDLHPTMKPVRLVANCLLDGSKEGDIVVDTFGGSGTTLIAAEQLGRKCYMMELDPHYCDVIIARWEKLTGKKAVKIAG